MARENAPSAEGASFKRLLFWFFKSLPFLGLQGNGTLAIQQNAETLDLHLLKTVLPDDDERGDTVLAVVEEDNPKFVLKNDAYCFAVRKTLTFRRGSWTRQCRTRSP